MKQNFFILNAYPGHGKDFTLSILSELMNTDFYQVQFALKAKQIIASALPSRFFENNDLDKVSVLNELKDKKMDLKIIGDYNMRNVLQLMLGDVFRTINPDINILFTLKSLEEKLLNNKSNYICTDNRYRNEQEFLYPLTKISDNEEKIDYVRWRLLNNLTNFNKDQILEIFDNLTNKIILDSKDLIILNKIKINFLNENEKLNETEKNKYDYTDFVRNIDFEQIGKMNKEEGLENGLIHIFRPILPINLTCENKDIINNIMEYTKFNNNEVLFIKNNYERYNIEFNSSNINKYGFLRADPMHLSERDLDGRKPEPFLNIPSHLENNLYEELKKQLIQKKNCSLKKIKHT